MTAKEVREFYKLIGSTYGLKEPNEAEAKSWVEVLAFFAYSEMDAAWRRWQNDTTVEQFSQRPRGARMPKAAELKASMEWQRQREANARTGFIPCRMNGCMDGWIYMDKVEGEKSQRVKRCECWHEYAQAVKA